MIEIWISLLILLSGLTNGLGDSILFHWSKSIPYRLGWNPMFWKPQYSWRNKYKNHDPNQGPKFWGSTTIFVWLTDGWHLLKTICFSCWQLIPALYLGSIWWEILIYFFAAKLIQGIGFKVLYR